MKAEISAAAFAASQSVASRGLTVKRSQLSEVIAALLGYRTFAALSIEEGDTTLTYHLDDAEFLVLNEPLGLTRCQELNLSDDVVTDCSDAFRGQVLVPVFKGVADFFGNHLHDEFVQTLYDSDEANDAMAESNASYPDGPDLEEPETSGDLWAATADWWISVEGSLTGEYDPDGDRMFNGNEIGVSGKMTFDKAGRAGLIYVGTDTGGGVDDSWRDDDRDDEMDFRLDQQA